MSPANFPATNPEAIRKAIETRSARLTDSMNNLIEDLHKGRITRVDENAFDVGRNLAATPGSVIFEHEFRRILLQAAIYVSTYMLTVFPDQKKEPP